MTEEQVSFRPPRLLLTLLGDYWWQQNAHLPSAALVALLAEFGVSDTAARAALSRLVRHGLLVMSKQGRQTFYRLREAASQLAELSITTSTMFRARVGEDTSEGGLPQHAWDLDALCAHYQQFIADVQPLIAHIRDRLLSPEEALKARTRIMDIWQGFPSMDPDLPDELLPADWPRAQARQLFIDIYDELGPLAQRRVQQIIARYAPDLAANAAHHNSSDTLIATGPAA